MAKKPETGMTTTSGAGNQMATRPPGALAARPDRIQKGDRRGMETMTKDDLKIPRLSLAQALSPQVTEGDPRRIEGLTPGDLFNSLSKENYGREVFVQIIRKDRLRAMEFHSIDDGGGVKDPNVPLTDERCKWHGDEKPVATVFRDYIARIIHPDGRREMIALSFKSTGLEVAKSLNGLIAMRNAPIFDGLYRITTDTRLDPKPYKIYQVENADWVSDEDSAAGAEMYEAMKDLDLSDRIDRDAGREPGDEDFDPAEMEAAAAGRPPM